MSPRRARGQERGGLGASLGNARSASGNCFPAPDGHQIQAELCQPALKLTAGAESFTEMGLKSWHSWEIKGWGIWKAVPALCVLEHRHQVMEGVGLGVRLKIIFKRVPTLYYRQGYKPGLGHFQWSAWVRCC